MSRGRCRKMSRFCDGTNCNVLQQSPDVGRLSRWRDNWTFPDTIKKAFCRTHPDTLDRPILYRL